MKKLILFAAVLFCFSLPAFGNTKDKADTVSDLRQAADELKESNPKLSKRLNDYAEKKEKWKGKKGEMEKHIQQRKADIQKIREAAVALEATHKDLAHDLKEIAERLEKKPGKKHEKTE